MTEVIRIDEYTWRIEDGGVRMFLLEGNEKALLIDTGMNTPDAKDVALTLTTLPLELLNTHADPDHISGNAGFEFAYMSPAEEENYRGHNGNGRIEPIREGDMIDLGDRPLLVLDNPGHTPGSVAILDVKNRVLIGGDSIQDGNIFMFGPHRNLPAYRNSLLHLCEYRDRFDIVFPSHGTFPVGADLIPELISAADAILEGTAEGRQIELFGKSVTLYKFPCAGFLMQ